jgi:NAD(P)-dependent dehydrogenase (short-subunit alcohol dehydrogenase family)
MRSLKSLMDLSGRAVLITGGAGHIGRAMADAVAELGASVAIADLREENRSVSRRGWWLGDGTGNGPGYGS